MKQPIAIFGTGGLAKELVGYIGAERPDNPWDEPQRYEVMVAVSTEQWSNPRFTIPVIHQPNEVVRAMSCLLAIGDPAARRAVVNRWPDLRWMTYIHRSAEVSSYASYGIGCIIAPHAIVAGDAVIGDFCLVNASAAVRHDCTIGDYVTLSPYADACGHCSIGDECFIGIGAYVLPHVQLPPCTNVSAGAVVRSSISKPAKLYGDPAKPKLKAI